VVNPWNLIGAAIGGGLLVAVSVLIWIFAEGVAGALNWQSEEPVLRLFRARRNTRGSIRVMAVLFGLFGALMATTCAVQLAGMS
jgi:hypothetical protein